MKGHISTAAAALGLATLLLTSCFNVGPNYQRPNVPAPPQYRGQEGATGGSGQSFGEEKWETVFPDPTLQNLIRTALKQNYDVRIAATRVLQAQQQVTVTRSNEFPTVGAGPGFFTERSPQIGPIPAYTVYLANLEGSISWDIDFWGRYRRATEAARAMLLSTEWGRRQVIATVVANVASDYFTLRALDLDLDISKRTLASDQESLKITQTLEQGGATSMVDVDQAQQLVETAAAAIPNTERQIAQEEDALSTLLGNNPGDIPRGNALADEPLPITIPAGIPSTLLERRPDIREAEQNLIAANANIGEARAALYPNVSLTGYGGLESAGLASLFSGGAGLWSLTASLTQPIFNAGRLRAQVRLTEAQEQQQLLTYRQTIQQAFQSVADALVAYGKYREFREHEERLTAAAQDAAKLSEIRYRGGVTSYLEVLTDETNYFTAELGLAQARLNERLALVQVYNTLGGGWQQ
ncbi:MAG: efflux transporter outer membrane subunit [Bryobacteraceae bacterium]